AYWRRRACGRRARLDVNVSGGRAPGSKHEMITITQVAELILVGWLPGLMIFRLPWFNRDMRAGVEAEKRAFWSVILSVAVSLAIVLGLAVFHRYSFGRLMIADAVVTVG